MNKGSKIAILGSALAIVATLGYSAYAANDNVNANNRQCMLQDAVEKGIITEEKKSELETFNHEQMQNMMNERVNEKLAEAVTNQDITQEEANEIQSWHDAKPESISKIRGLGFGEMGRFNRKGQGMGKPNADITNTSTETQ